MDVKKFVLITTLLVVTGCISVFGQKEEATAAAKWERYVGAGGEVSILLPKKPIVIPSGYWCSKFESITYWAYAEEVAYEFKIVSKSVQPNLFGCRQVVPFDEDAYLRRVSELKGQPDWTGETEVVQGGKNGWRVLAGLTTKWIFNDLKNGRWVELSIMRRPDVKIDEDRFIKSIDFSGTEDGIKIGKGSKLTIGDVLNFVPDVVQDTKKLPKETKVEALVIAAKPRARYTGSAREGKVQGAVKLRVTFKADGSVGDISVVSGLPDGLTEQAIDAVRKVVFIPMKVDGKLTTTSKVVEYTFSIY